MGPRLGHWRGSGRLASVAVGREGATAARRRGGIFESVGQKGMLGGRYGFI